MSNKCSGAAPRLEKLQNEPFLQRPFSRPGTPMPLTPGSGAPSAPLPPVTEAPYPSVPQPEGVTQMPEALNPIMPNTPFPADLMPGDPSNDFSTRNPLIPNVFPNVPSFVVPSNPLLPPGYQEVLDYDSLQYMNGFLRTQIGRPCEVEFQIGSNSMVSRSGLLIAVGINYILLQEPESNDILTCDFYSIKFVRFYY